MILDSVFIEGSMMKITTLHTVIIGGGIAGMSCAVSLFDHGVRDIAILVDSREGAASRYAKGDHQSYCKLADYGSESDSPYRMARAMTSSGDCDGDNAFVEATLSSRCFYRLVEMGVPFEEDEYGAFVSSDPDTDKTKRMVSAGSDTTNRIMASLEREVKARGIPIYENHQVIRILTDDDKKKAVGVLALNRSGLRERHQRFLLFNAVNIVLASGGPGGLFFHEGYPRSHAGCLGIALEAGVKAQNLSEFVIGLCAVRRSLMMNGAFQRALPRYVSTDASGRDIKEFLLPYFENPEELYRLQMLKGSQWAFDAKKVRSDASSLIDLLVFNEIILKGRHVFMDYRENPSNLPEAMDASSSRPFERLRNLSPDAYSALLDQQLDPAENPIEIYPSVVHHCGGISVDTNYQSSLQHLYAIGEAAGTQGSLVLSGSSMNQTQVSALRAALAIVRDTAATPLSIDPFVAFARNKLHQCVRLADRFNAYLDVSREIPKEEPMNIRAARLMIGRKMDRACALYRDKSRIEYELSRAKILVSKMDDYFMPNSQIDLCLLFQIEDLLLAQISVLSAMLDELNLSSGSRGSHLVYDSQGTLPSAKLSEMYRFSVSDKATAGKIQQLTFDASTLESKIEWREQRPIPKV